MRLQSLWIVIALFMGISTPAYTQFREMFEAAVADFASQKQWEYEEIPIKWTMEGSLQADLNEGVNSLFEHEPAVAAASFTAVLAKDPKVWQAYYYRAACLKQQRKFSNAMFDLGQAIAIHGDFYEGYIEKAKVLLLMNRIPECEKALDRAIELDKSRGLAYYLRGDLALKMQDFVKANDHYKKCLQFDSQFHDARIKEAILESAIKKDESVAVAHMDKVLQYDSLQKTALLFRSILLFDKNEKQSLRDLNNLISVSPHNIMAYYLRGVHLTKMQKYEQAFSDFQRVVKSTSTSDNNFTGQQTWVDKKIDIQNVGAYTMTRVYGLDEADAARIKEAYCHIITEDYPKAIAIINEMPDPNAEPLAAYLKAVAYEHKGEHRMAFTFYNEALKLDNSISDAYKKRGIYWQEMRQWDKSINDFNTVLRQDPGSFVTYNLRGLCYFHNNQFDKAIADWNKYLEYDSLNKTVIAQRGMAYLNTGQKRNAYLDLARSENFNALNFKDMGDIVQADLAKGDTVGAMNFVDEIISTAPFFTEGYVQKFKVHLARNEWKIIEEQINRAIINSRADSDISLHSYLLTVEALAFAHQKKEAEALKTFDEAIKTDNKNDFAYLERGKLHLARGKSSKAKEDFEHAVRLGNKTAAIELKRINN